MPHQPNQIPAGEFKAKCLHLMDVVNKSKKPIIITKRGIPIAQLVPIEEKTFDIFGCLKGSVTINEDIIKPVKVAWEADE